MRNICTKFVQVKAFFCQCAIYIYARFAQDNLPNVQYMSKNAQDLHKIISPMRNICARLYLFLQCTIYAHDCTSFPNVQYMCKICTSAQYCTYFSNAQYMRKICVRLYFFPQYARFAQDCTYFLQSAIYAQDLRKIVLLSPMRNKCQDLHKIVLLSTMRNI